MIACAKVNQNEWETTEIEPPKLGISHPFPAQVDDIESWNAAVRAANEERGAAAATVASRAHVRVERRRGPRGGNLRVDARRGGGSGGGSALGRGGRRRAERTPPSSPRADAKGWSETFVAVLCDALPPGQTVEDVEAPVMRAMLRASPATRARTPRTPSSRPSRPSSTTPPRRDDAPPRTHTPSTPPREGRRRRGARDGPADADAFFFFGDAPRPAPCWACSACTLENPASSATWQWRDRAGERRAAPASGATARRAAAGGAARSRRRGTPEPPAATRTRAACTSRTTRRPSSAAAPAGRRGPPTRRGGGGAGRWSCV